jgi:hypothetical protein
MRYDQTAQSCTVQHVGAARVRCSTAQPYRVSGLHASARWDRRSPDAGASRPRRASASVTPYAAAANVGACIHMRARATGRCAPIRQERRSTPAAGQTGWAATCEPDRPDCCRECVGRCLYCVDRVRCCGGCPWACPMRRRTDRGQALNSHVPAASGQAFKRKCLESAAFAKQNSQTRNFRRQNGMEVSAHRCTSG